MCNFWPIVKCLFLWNHWPENIYTSWWPLTWNRNRKNLMMKKSGKFVKNCQSHWVWSYFSKVLIKCWHRTFDFHILSKDDSYQCYFLLYCWHSISNEAIFVFKSIGCTFWWSPTNYVKRVLPRSLHNFWLCCGQNYITIQIIFVIYMFNFQQICTHFANIVTIYQPIISAFLFTWLQCMFMFSASL